MYAAKGSMFKAIAEFIKKIIAMLRDLLAKVGVELPSVDL